jgi:hypothetical protein
MAGSKQSAPFFRRQRQAHQQRQKIIDDLHRDAVATEDDMPGDQEQPYSSFDVDSPSIAGPSDQFDDLTRAFVRLNNLPACPLDRLSRYEATLWRQACQILFTLQCLSRRRLNEEETQRAHDLTSAILRERGVYRRQLRS